jgi:CRP-like cAMP-binding protein
MNIPLDSAQSAQRRAADMLITKGALVELSHDDARVVVGYMTPRRFPAGTVLMREGDTESAGFMLLVLDGEVTVENSVHGDDESMVVSVVHAGSLIGEMGLLDGGRRSATCVASSQVNAAVLSREQLTALLSDAPQVAARLLLALSKRVVDHLRETNRKLLTFAQLSKALQQELDGAHIANRRLLEEINRLKAVGHVSEPPSRAIW